MRSGRELRGQRPRRGVRRPGELGDGRRPCRGVASHQPFQHRAEVAERRGKRCPVEGLGRPPGSAVERQSTRMFRRSFVGGEAALLAEHDQLGEGLTEVLAEEDEVREPTLADGTIAAITVEDGHQSTADLHRKDEDRAR